MGQFGDQPDFGTQAIRAGIAGDANTGIGVDHYGDPCALYVGTGGDILANVVGGNDSNYGENATLFKNVPSGTFMPVMVSNIWLEFDGETLTTASDIVGLR